jgi:hypothetical protein
MEEFLCEETILKRNDRRVEMIPHEMYQYKNNNYHQYHAKINYKIDQNIFYFYSLNIIC